MKTDKYLYVCYTQKSKTRIKQHNMAEDIENKDIAVGESPESTQNSIREKILQRLKTKHPDKQFANDDELFGTIDNDYTDYDNQLSSYRDVDNKMTNLFESNPQFAGMFISAIRGDKNPVLTMIETFGEDFRNYLDNPENAKDIAEANAKFVERLNKEKDLESVYEKNLENSLAVAEELKNEGGYSDEQIDIAFKSIIDDAGKAIMGEINKEMLENKLKGLNHDNDVQEAAMEASIKAKNEKIEAKKKSFSNEMPMIEGKGSGQEPAPGNKKMAAYDKAIKRKEDIYKGMKRY